VNNDQRFAAQLDACCGGPKIHRATTKEQSMIHVPQLQPTAHHPTCGICDPIKMRTGICDSHARQALELTQAVGLTYPEAVASLYNDAVDATREAVCAS
jgi:hypothetical protein